MDDIIEETAEQKERHLGRFFISFVMVFKNWCIWSQLKRKFIFMYICQVFFCCWGQSRCAVCYGFSWQCCKWKQKKKWQKCITISPEDARSKPTVIVLCSTWTLFECFFYFWGTSTKKLNYTVCHCCTVSVEIWILCLVL